MTLRESARMMELCHDLIQWLEDEHLGSSNYVKDYVKEVYPELYNKIFGHKDD